MSIKLLFTIIISLIASSLEGNMTDCYYMYLNKTTNVNCLNETACCYYSYMYNDILYHNCDTKRYLNESICNQYSLLINRNNGNMIECDCSMNMIKLIIAILIFLMLQF